MQTICISYDMIMYKATSKMLASWMIDLFLDSRNRYGYSWHVPISDNKLIGDKILSSQKLEGEELDQWPRQDIERAQHRPLKKAGAGAISVVTSSPQTFC